MTMKRNILMALALCAAMLLPQLAEAAAQQQQGRVTTITQAYQTKLVRQAVQNKWSVTGVRVSYPTVPRSTLQSRDFSVVRWAPHPANRITLLAAGKINPIKSARAPKGQARITSLHSIPVNAPAL
jgi:hypothetical protein